MIKLVLLAVGLVAIASANESQCGQQKIAMSRVVGGKDAVPGSWPWQVAMLHYGKFSCGATLVNAKWVVTSARCADRAYYLTSDFEMVLGDHDRKKVEAEQRIPVSRIIKHPKYSVMGKSDNDIALMELARPVLFTDRVQPACLPDQDEEPAVGSICYLTGWGKIRGDGLPSHPILQQLGIAVQSNADCNALNGKYFPVTENMLCATNPDATTNQSGCFGDSGGPLVCQQDNGSWKLQGAVSWGSFSCDAKDAMTVFTRVSKYRSWMDQYIDA